MTNEKSDEPPTSGFVVSNPKWRLTPVAGGTLLQLQHPEHGWLSFLLPVAERAAIVGYLLQQALSPVVGGEIQQHAAPTLTKQ